MLFRSPEFPRGVHSANKDPKTGVEFRGKKGQLYEGGLRVPVAARWPGRISAGRVSDHLWYFPDILPTIAELCGAQTPADIDGIFVGHFNGGFLPQDFSAALVAMAIPALRHVPAVRLENACATGSAAIWAALDAVQSGRVKRALVVGFEKMNTLPGAQIGDVLLKCSYVKEEAGKPGGFAGI